MEDEEQYDENNFTLKEFIDVVYQNIPISNLMNSSIFDLGHKNSKLFSPTTISGKIIRVNQSKSEEYARQIVCRHCRSIHIMKNDWIFHEKTTKKSLRIIKDDMHLSEMERKRNITKTMD
jgi:hypothetical protein